MQLLLVVMILGADPVEPPVSLQLKLLRRTDVLEELGVIEDQLKEVMAAPERDVDAEQAILRNREEGKEKEAIRSVETLREGLAVQKMLKVQAILLPHQLKRLRELAWQYQLVFGWSCLSNMGVKVTDNTEKKMQSIVEKRKIELLQYVKKFEEDTMKMVLEELSAEDQQKLEKALGKKFKFDLAIPDRF